MSWCSADHGRRVEDQSEDVHMPVTTPYQWYHATLLRMASRQDKVSETGSAAKFSILIRRHTSIIVLVDN